MERRSTVGGQPSTPARTGMEAVSAVLRPRGSAVRPAFEEDGASFNVMVDGVKIAVEGRGKAARLTCVLDEQTPAEDALRALMAQYFRYADRGADVLCVDPEGRLLLVADFEVGGDAASFTAAFCDAAVHWHAMARRSVAQQTRRTNPSPLILFP